MTVNWSNASHQPRDFMSPHQKIHNAVSKYPGSWLLQLHVALQVRGNMCIVHVVTDDSSPRSRIPDHFPQSVPSLQDSG
ncbi:hypothetical protein PBY51_011321 [Eleginops maclovinus]|uniref:Uncharacterized protein n=1 Tax=Eleginops maclovinus TaxID=56733 RepID=A0AAN8ANS4_ELEMC|nr:hypothetical protein PBY51_011321 [Eleginops maclovinus]